MAFEFEALVGHLYIVNGRAIHINPPGALVEVAPKQAARGREMDTFFTLVMPAGDVAGPSSFYEQMAKLAAERYFNSSGSVTSGMRSVYNSLNENLFEHNASGKQRYEVNMICAVLHGDDLFVTRVGTAVAVVLNGGEMQPFPGDFASSPALKGPVMGALPIPDIKMTRHRVLTGMRLVMADERFAELDMLRVRTALTSKDISEVIAAFKQTITGTLAMQVIEFVPPEVSAPVPVVEAYSTSAEGTMRLKTTSPDQPAAPTVPPVDRALETRIRVQRGASNAAGAVANGLENATRVLERITTRETNDGRRVTRFLTSGVAVMIPIVIVVLVLVMWLGGTGQSEFELCVSEATQAVDLARQIDSSDRSAILAAWGGVQIIVDRCNEIREGDAQLAAFVREGQEIIDRLNEIKRRDTTTIASFPNAELARVVLRGEDLYVLDNRNDLVYRVSITSDGMSATANSLQQIPRMRRGAAAGQYTVGDIFDITWAEDGGGLSQGNVLISVDRNGVIVEYSPTFLSQGAQSLLGTENWVNPVRALIWQGRLYILDPGANQIWRYDPTGNSFPNSPREYFTGANRFDISQAVDFGIDDNGRVYLTLADGSINVYRSAEPVAFSYAAFPNNAPPARADAMFLNINPVSPGIYLVDRENRTVYEASLAGTFISSYRTYNEDLFAGLADVVADESKRVVYVVSGNAILGFQK